MLSNVLCAFKFVRPPRLIGPWSRESNVFLVSAFLTGRIAPFGQTFSHMPQPTQAFASVFTCFITGIALCVCFGSGNNPSEVVLSMRITSALIA